MRWLPIALNVMLVLGVTLIPIQRSYAQTTEISIISVRSYIDQYGFYHLVGEVQNNLKVTASFVKIVATFYDSSGRVVGTDFTFTMVDVLRPGEKSPFERASTDTAQIQKIASFKLASDWIPSTSLSAKLRLKVGDSYLDQYGFYHLVGEVVNQGEMKATYVKVSAALYDSDKKLLASSFTFTANDIAPGQVAPFEIALTDPFASSIKSSSVNVQSIQYSSVLDSKSANSSSKQDNPQPKKAEEVRPTYQVNLTLSASLTDKTKTLTVSLKNPSKTDAKVYEVSFSLPDNVQIKSATGPSGWTKEINGNNVTFSTDDKPLLANKSMKVSLKLDKTVRSLDWDAYDEDGNIINSKTASIQVRK